MLQSALKARIPLIGIQTSDLVHLQPVLTEYCKQAGLPTPQKLDPEEFTLDKNSAHILLARDCPAFAGWDNLYTEAALKQATIVVVNLPPDPTILDCGTLMPPEKLVKAFVLSTLDDHTYDLVQALLRGLTLLEINNILSLAFTDEGGLSVRGLQYWRSQMNRTPGLERVSSDQGFYIPDPGIEEWLDMVRPSFFGDDEDLVPRGIMAHGTPGTGKTAIARWIGDKWHLPVYRVDLGRTLSKYLGESENRFATAIQQLEAEEPCIVLLDEMEKFFNTEGDTGATSRMLGGLLWWLQEHRCRVLTVMTTNNLGALPGEVYRPGRIDRVFQTTGLGWKPEGLGAFVWKACKHFDCEEHHGLIVEKILAGHDKVTPISQATAIGFIKAELQQLKAEGATDD